LIAEARDHHDRCAAAPPHRELAAFINLGANLGMGRRQATNVRNGAFECRPQRAAMGGWSSRTASWTISPAQISPQSDGPSSEVRCCGPLGRQGLAFGSAIGLMSPQSTPGTFISELAVHLGRYSLSPCGWFPSTRVEINIAVSHVRFNIARSSNGSVLFAV